MRIFVDACCLYPAIRSPGGGSAKIILDAKEYGFVILLTPMVLEETKVHVIKDLGKKAFAWLTNILKSSPDQWELIEDPTPAELKRWKKTTVKKDIHVLAGAIKGKADVLVTLDRQHLLKDDVRKSFPIPIMDTKKFWKTIKEGSEALME